MPSHDGAAYQEAHSKANREIDELIKRVPDLQGWKRICIKYRNFAKKELLGKHLSLLTQEQSYSDAKWIDMAVDLSEYFTKLFIIASFCLKKIHHHTIASGLRGMDCFDKEVREFGCKLIEYYTPIVENDDERCLIAFATRMEIGYLEIQDEAMDEWDRANSTPIQAIQNVGPALIEGEQAAQLAEANVDDEHAEYKEPLDHVTLSGKRKQFIKDIIAAGNNRVPKCKKVTRISLVRPIGGSRKQLLSWEECRPGTFRVGKFDAEFEEEITQKAKTFGVDVPPELFIERRLND